MVLDVPAKDDPNTAIKSPIDTMRTARSGIVQASNAVPSRAATTQWRRACTESTGRAPETSPALRDRKGLAELPSASPVEGSGRHPSRPESHHLLPCQPGTQRRRRPSRHRQRQPRQPTPSLGDRGPPHQRSRRARQRTAWLRRSPTQQRLTCRALKPCARPPGPLTTGALAHPPGPTVKCCVMTIA